MRSVAVLVATRDRPELLVRRAISSVCRQVRRPERLVVVNDGVSFDDLTMRSLVAACTLAEVDLAVLPNSRHLGAGGAWNTGLAYLEAIGHDGFVALLDDDDEWDDDHIDANLRAASSASIVVSGLRMVVADRVLARPLIECLAPHDFLTGNPGWQGSNTFVDLELLIAAGGFREGLPSLNDRDVAYRLLLQARGACSFTGVWTSTWYADTPGNLSAARSGAKVDGLRAFWCLYREAMRPAEQLAFFSRAHLLFGVSADEICEHEVALPPLGFPRSSSHGPSTY